MKDEFLIRWQWRMAWRTVRSTYTMRSCENISMWHYMLDRAHQCLVQREEVDDLLLWRQQLKSKCMTFERR